MEGKYFLGAVGVIAVTCMEITALVNGIDGTYLSGCVGAICGIIGAVAGISIKLVKPEP